MLPGLIPKNEKVLLKLLFITFLAGRWLYSTALPCSDYVQSLKPFYYQREKNPDFSVPW